MLDRLQIVSDVAKDLGNLHSQGVVHRSIEPSNVLLRWQHSESGSYNEPRIVAEMSDLSLSKEVDNVTSDALKGRVDYMDPHYQ